MSKIDIEILRAFKALGVSDAIAEQAAATFQGALADEFSRIENRFDKLDGSISRLELDLAARLTRLETTATWHTWIIGTSITLSVAMLGLMAGLFGLIIHKLGG